MDTGKILDSMAEMSPTVENEQKKYTDLVAGYVVSGELDPCMLPAPRCLVRT